MKRWILPSAVTLLALAFAFPARAQRVMITGYADLEFMEFQQRGKATTFDNHHFNVIGLAQLTEKLNAAVEVEFEHAGEEVELEFGYLNWKPNDYVEVVAGKFLVPFGVFNENIHPTWINKMVSIAPVLRTVVPVAWGDVGLQVRGAVDVSEMATFSYIGYVVNGFEGDEGTGIRDLRDNVRDTNDSNKSLGGRLGLVLASDNLGTLEFGGSVFQGAYTPDGEFDLALFGFDAAYQKSGFEIRGEYAAARQEVTGDTLDKNGFYAQAAYVFLPKYLEGVVRVGVLNFPQPKDDGTQLVLGLNYFVNESTTLRVNYDINQEESGFRKNNNVFAAQLSIGF